MVPDSVVKFMFNLEDELADTSVSSLTMQIDTGTPSFEMDMTSQQEHVISAALQLCSLPLYARIAFDHIQR